MNSVTTLATRKYSTITVRALSVPTPRTLLRGISSILIINANTDLGSLVRHKRLKFAESPSVHLSLS
ncbi:MAG: hypothetical protein R6U51_02270, partial [Anaerolineales bacterium]